MQASSKMSGLIAALHGSNLSAAPLIRKALPCERGTSGLSSRKSGDMRLWNARRLHYV